MLYVVPSLGEDRVSDLYVNTEGGFTTNKNELNTTKNPADLDEDEIIIHVKNDAQITMNIHKVSTEKGEDGNEKPIEGAVFNVEEVTIGDISSVKTYTTNATDVNGNVTLAIKLPERYESTVMYTITEDKLEGYEEYLPQNIYVSYDSKGQIYNIYPDDETKAEVLTEFTNGTETKETIGSRTIPLVVTNTPNARDVQYDVKIVPTIEYSDGTDAKKIEALDDIKYRLTIDQQHGDPLSFEERTSSKEEGGILYHRETMNGYGTIKCNVTLTDSQGYTGNTNTRTIIFKKDNTGKISEESSTGLFYSIDNDKHIIYIIDKILPADDVFELYIQKRDSESKLPITENPAYFVVTEVNSGDTDDEEYDDTDDEDDEEYDDEETDYIDPSLARHTVSYDANGGDGAPEYQERHR